MNGSLLVGEKVVFTEPVRVFAILDNDVAVNVQITDIFKPGTDFEDACLFGIHLGDLDDLVGEGHGALRFFREEREIGFEHLCPRFERAVEILTEGEVLLVEVLVRPVQFVQLSLKFLISVVEGLVDGLEFGLEIAVTPLQEVVLVGVFGGRNELLAQPGFGQKTEDFTLIDGVDNGVETQNAGDEDAGGLRREAADFLQEFPSPVISGMRWSEMTVGYSCSRTRSSPWVGELQASTSKPADSSVSRKAMSTRGSSSTMRILLVGRSDITITA